MKRRALSTVITTALMITAVAVIGTGVVVWSNSNLRTYENNLAISSSNMSNKINETPVIENVVLYSKPVYPLNYVNVTISNIGTGGLTVKQIKISDSTQSNTFSISNGNINKQSSQLFGPYSYTWQRNVVVTVEVTTVRGTILSTQAMHT